MRPARSRSAAPSHVDDVAGRQHQRIGTADDIGARGLLRQAQHRLGRPATVQTSDRLGLSLPFPPEAARCASL